MRHPGLLIALALSACAVPTPQRQAAAAQRQMAALQFEMQIDDMRCRSYGAPPGSPIYVSCRQQAEAQRQTQLRLSIGGFGF